ncbi:MBL fold metallo-hydrolase [Oscillochloris sp. ZM17-4]|uniref:MBL fold metallo-hydrolase n=1 Tax=Oscillochloris sp. ZM17-4 TaxID=2866714 RepID=UPI001C72DE4E|nr:MBL fold metallo-hydrolase [Oscillochloris sp. ZM17-4]MBX0327353.1 MBL fold metallo-hydrolase [Oscillochloris sp. ZM17-4]
MSIVTLAPDIIQVQLPLPFALRSVNCYLLRDAEGWTVLDTGLHTPDGEDAWRSTLAELRIKPHDIRQIVLTHFHPDHYGMAGWLQALSGAPVLISPRDAEQVGEVWEIPEGTEDPTLAHFTRHGVPGELTGTIVGVVEMLRGDTLPHPKLSLISAGERIAMGGRDFLAIHAPGHSDGQLIFFSEGDGLMLCGDHVLMKITPHIGWWPNSEPDPLGRYLGSLEALESLPVRLALSGHRGVIADWPGRLRELRLHHEERLGAMAAAVGASANAYEVATRTFAMERYTPHEIRFAVAETVAHLELLVLRGELRHEGDAHIRYIA